MKGWSTSAGDHHWQAGCAIEQLATENETLREENERLLFANLYNTDMFNQMNDARKEAEQERDQLKAVIAQCHEAMCAVSQAAYDNAFPVCCGYAGAECCGLPDPDWSEHDKLIMDTLDGPINAVANQLRAKASEA
jgi:hypothetical protein